MDETAVESGCVRGPIVAGCGADTAEPTGQGVTRVRVALFPGGSTLPAHVAITKGICERNGLQIELTEGTDLPVFIAASPKASTTSP